MGPSSHSPSQAGKTGKRGPLRVLVLLFFFMVLLLCGIMGALIINPDLAYLLPGDAAQKFYEMGSAMRSSLTGLFADGGPLAGVRRFAEPYLSRVGLNVETILVGLGLLLLTIACIRMLSVTSHASDDEDEAEESFGPVPESPEDRPSASPYWPYDRRPGRRSAPGLASDGGAAKDERADRGRFAFGEATTGDAWLTGTRESRPPVPPEIAAAAEPAPGDGLEDLGLVPPELPDRGGGFSGPPESQPLPAGTLASATQPLHPPGAVPVSNLVDPLTQAGVAATPVTTYPGQTEDEEELAPSRPEPDYGAYQAQPGRSAPVDYIPPLDEGYDELPAPQFARSSFEHEEPPVHRAPPPPRPAVQEALITGRPQLGSGLKRFTVPGLLLLALGAGGAYGLQTPYAAIVTSSPHAPVLLAGLAGLLGTITATWFAAGPMKPVSRRIAVSTAGAGGGPGRGRPSATAPRPVRASNLAPALAPVPRRSDSGGGLDSPDSADWSEVPKPSVFIPWSQNTTSLGVDVGSAWTKVVQLDAGKNGLEMVNVGLCSTPEGAVTENGVEDPEALGAAIQKLLGDRNIIQRRTVSAIGGQGVIIRHVQFPVMAPEELREVVRWEAEHHIPIPPGEAVIDFTVLPGQGDADDRGHRQMRVMLVGAQRSMVNAHVEALKSAKLLPDGLDVEALAAFRVVSAAGHFVEDPARYAQAVIDLGHTTTKLSVYLRDALEMSRALPVGGFTFTTALSSDLRVSEMEAEILKRQYGVRADGGRVLQTLAPTLQDLLFEIRRSFEFFSSRHFGQAVRHVYLIGGGARMPGLGDAMSRYLNLALGERVPEGAAVRVDVVDPLTAVALSPKLSQQMGLIGPEFVTALGLALGGQEVLHAG